MGSFRLILFLICTLPAFKAQSQIDINNKERDKDPIEFKHWLSSSWLKKDLVFDTGIIEKNVAYIYLKLDCINNCQTKWNAIKLAYDTVSSFSFEEYLFYKTCFLFDIPLRSAKIEIENQTNELELPCFRRIISFSNNFVSVESENCKELNSSSNLSFKDFNPIFGLSSSKRLSQDDKLSKNVLSFIHSKCVEYFEARDKNGIVESDVKGDHLVVLKVRNLNNEVIPKRIISASTIEWIQISIKCEIHSLDAEFSVLIMGKYGSKRFAPLEGKYNDMEENYKLELQNYVDIFTKSKLLKWLK
ncbi:MAG: hypothetical protein JWQ09_2863 [Segetibacter sp.]|nr:hypothetical protein [Segetibacter sp.]